jgi:chromosome segregation ATPase
LQQALIELEASETRYSQLRTQTRELTGRLTQALASQKTLEESLKTSAEQLTEAQNEQRSLEEKSQRLDSELRKALRESDESRKQAEEARLLITKLEADLNAASGISTGFLRPALNELEESVKKDAQKIQSLTLQRNLALGGCAFFALGSLALGLHALTR